MLNRDGILKDSIQTWFKKSLTSIYLSNPDAPESLNYLDNLSQEQKESALAQAFQYFGVKALPKYKKLKGELNIQNMNEKLILWYWDADARNNNQIDKVIDELGKKKPLKYDLEYVAENLNPNNLLKYQSVEINKRFVPFSELTVLTKRYVSNNEKIFCQINEEKDTTELSVIFNLFCCQTVLRSMIHKKLKSSTVGSAEPKVDPARFLGDMGCQSPMDVFEIWPIAPEARKSMEEFISRNKEAPRIFKDVQSDGYWSEVQSCYSSLVLNETLNLSATNSKKKLNKV